MRYCPGCKIKVDGNLKQCPLCQNALSGEIEDPVYPSRQEFRKKSILYKIQLFILIAIMLVSVVLDFVFELNGHIHWSIIVAAWVIGGEFSLAKLIHKHKNLSWDVAHCSLWLALLIMITFIPINQYMLYFEWIMPGISAAAQIFHFVLMMKDKSQNAMIYLLGSSFINTVISITYMSVMREKSIPWMTVLLLSVICVVGAVIFKGKRVTSELEKRFHI